MSTALSKGNKPASVGHNVVDHDASEMGMTLRPAFRPRGGWEAVRIAGIRHKALSFYIQPNLFTINSAKHRRQGFSKDKR
jgi:hypothetical protein